MFNKLEHLLDQKEYIQSVISILLKSTENKQKVPESILSKLSGIEGNKDYVVDIWNKVNLVIVSSLGGRTKLSDSILANLIDNNFVLKIYTDDIALQVTDLLYLYFENHPKALEKYGDKIIDVIVDETLNCNVRSQLCFIVNNWINKRDSSWHLSQEKIGKLEGVFEYFPVNQALEIFTILASVRKVQNARLSDKTLEKAVNVVGDEAIDAAQELEKLAEQGIKLTKSCWQNLNRVLAESNTELLDIVAKIIAYAADSSQEVPTDIVITLKNCRYLGGIGHY